MAADDWRAERGRPDRGAQPGQESGEGNLRSRYDYRYEQRERHRAETRDRPAQPGYSRPARPDPYYRGHADSYPPVRVYTNGGGDRGTTIYRSYEQQRGSGVERSTLGPRNGAPQRGVNDVIDMVERRYGGKVVGVESAGDHYRVRLLQRDGRVRTLQVPAEGY